MEDSFIGLSKRGISSKVFTVSTSLAIGGLFLGRGTLGTLNLGSLLVEVSALFGLIEEKVVPKVLMISSILSILERSVSRDSMTSKVLIILSMELSSLFKFS